VAYVSDIESRHRVAARAANPALSHFSSNGVTQIIVAAEQSTIDADPSGGEKQWGVGAPDLAVRHNAVRDQRRRIRSNAMAHALSTSPVAPRCHSTSSGTWPSSALSVRSVGNEVHGRPRLQRLTNARAPLIVGDRSNHARIGTWAVFAGSVPDPGAKDAVVCQLLTALTKSTIRIFRASAARIRATECEIVALAKRSKDCHPYSRDLYAYLFKHSQQ
jgi:hypothetical protein